jgi:3-oxoacyl-[acyl-carrier-protein] synthase III
MESFVFNSLGRIVFPANVFPELDFSVFETLEQFSEVIRRDFDTKAPTGTDILERVEADGYADRYELLTDLALNLFWANRYAITMYDKRPTRWRDVPRHRTEMYLPTLTPWENGERKVAAVAQAYESLPPRWDATAEEAVFAIVFDVFRHKRHHATDIPVIKPTIAELLDDDTAQTLVLHQYSPDFPRYSYQEILDCSHPTPELEALLRRAMVLHNQYPWDREHAQIKPVTHLDDDDFVVLYAPRSREVAEFIRRVKAGTGARHRHPATQTRNPIAPYPAVQVRERCTVMPRLEALAVVRGEHACTNEDLIRNAAYNWSPMTADEIRIRTGIEQRVYTERDLEDLALEASRQALAHAHRAPEEIGAVLFCSCTNARLIPAASSWLTGQLGMYQTHTSADIVAACAGMAYGVSDAVRILQEIERPLLVVCAEKFSDKIGSVRTSRMIFGDGAAAMVIGPATEPGAMPDIEVYQTYAGGPVSQVNAIVWPNPDFDNNITVYGPDVQDLAGRYIEQMVAELGALPDPDDPSRTLLESIDLVIPHQANKTMVLKLTGAAGLSPDCLYFNIEQNGNVSAASIPLAIHDAVRDGVIDRPMRVFAPGFGAGSVAGYVILRVDPAVVAREPDRDTARV